MKKLIAKLLVGIFSLGLCLNLSAEEWKTYKIKLEKGGQELSDDVITLEAGDKAEFVQFIASHYTNLSLVIKTRFDEDFAVEQFYYSSGSFPPRSPLAARENFRTVHGPCKIFIGASGAGGYSLFCNVKITRAHESQGRNITGYSLVLPESADTDYNLVLESSTDLVSWTADTSGTKTPSDKKRFYRLRAVKE